MGEVYDKREIPDELQQYFVRAELGLEKTPEEYVAKMVEIFREVRRVLRADGVCFLNLGDCYATTPAGCGAEGVSMSSNLHGIRGVSEKYRETLKSGHGQKRNTIVSGLKPKDLVGIPWRVAFALQADGWYLRQDIIWNKKNPMPESVKDRCTKAHEYIFMLTKSGRYFYDAEAVKEPSAYAPGCGWEDAGHEIARKTAQTSNPAFRHIAPNRNKRSVWTITTQPFPGAHFAVFPSKLIEPCILAGCPKGGTVLDPFMGSGTTALVSYRLGRRWLGIELSETYCQMAVDRIDRETAQGRLFG